MALLGGKPRKPLEVVSVSDDEDYDGPTTSALCRQGRCDYCHDSECSHDCHRVTYFPARRG
jgi:hypothetical protein